MRIRTTTFPVFRRNFRDQQDLASVINRSTSYVNDCMNGRRIFTQNELKLINEEIKRRETLEVLTNIYASATQI